MNTHLGAGADAHPAGSGATDLPASLPLLASRPPVDSATHGGDEVRLARVALCCLVEPGNRELHALVNEDGPIRTLERLATGDVAAGALRGAAAARLGGGDPWRIATEALDRAQRLGARVVIPEDDEWPPRLQDLIRISRADARRRVDRDSLPPLCLWVRGPWPLAQALEQAVAVVGARAATSYGTHVANDLAFGLAERGWTVVSGGAFGIDAAAHRGALTAGGITVAVLACGVDRPYPASHVNLFDRIIERGLLVSEWPPGAAPFRHRFLTRNRVIAAATSGTVMVEASARSGARQTLGRAILLGRPAMVVPGPVTSAMSVGCHELLREHPHTRLVTGLAQVMEEVGRIGLDLAPVERGPEHPHDSLDSVAAALLEAVPRRRTVGPEEIAAVAGIDMRDVLRRLPILADQGFLIERDGGYVLAPQASRASASRTSGQQ